MVQVLNKILTLEEFLQLPETKPAGEYINGQILQKPMPQGKHSRIQGKLVSIIENLVTESCIALALPELRCTFGERSIVPDVVVLRWDKIPRDENGDIANICLTYPDWTIEILSPNQNPIKVIGNICYCLDHGSDLGWLIDPETKSVLVFFTQQQPLHLENSEDILPVPEFIPELKLTIGDIFNWLKL